MSTETFSRNRASVTDLICVRAMEGKTRLANGTLIRQIRYLACCRSNMIAGPYGRSTPQKSDDCLSVGIMLHFSIMSMSIARFFRKSASDNAHFETVFISVLSGHEGAGRPGNFLSLAESTLSFHAS